MIQDFLRLGLYRPALGSVVVLAEFSRRFIDTLDDEAALHWLQHDRIARELARLNFPIGVMAAPRSFHPGRRDGSVLIGNIDGPNSRGICERALVLEAFGLAPSDITPERRHHHD